MKVVFVNPPKISRGHWVIAEDCCWGKGNVLNLPGASLASASQLKGSSYFDLSLDPPEKLTGIKPDVVVHPLEPQFHREIHEKMAVTCRKIHKGPGRVPQIVISVPAGYMKDYAQLKPNPFCVVYSEPERVFSSLNNVQTWSDLVEWREHAKGVAWVDDEGKYHKNPPLKNCMHDIKGTDFNLVPRHYWRYYPKVIYQVTRGCPYRCSFCVWGASTVTDRTFRMRPAEQVAEDLNQIRRIARKRPAIYMLNAQLTTNIRWAREFCSLMSDNPYPYKGNVNLRELTEENLKILMKSGMTNVSAGAEALTDPLLRKVNKCHTFEDMIRSIKILNKSKIWYWLHFLVGWGETSKDINETLVNIDKMKRAGIKQTNLSIDGPVIYYKGTVIRENPPCELVYDPKYGENRMKNIPDWSKVIDKLRNAKYLK